MLSLSNGFSGVLSNKSHSRFQSPLYDYVEVKSGSRRSSREPKFINHEQAKYLANQNLKIKNFMEKSNYAPGSSRKSPLAKSSRRSPQNMNADIEAARINNI